MPARVKRPVRGVPLRAGLTEVRFGPAADRRNAADRAHRGDLEGALGVISALDTGPRRGAKRRLAALFAVLGPGLVVMVADNDAGGISTYAQAGQDWRSAIGEFGALVEQLGASAGELGQGLGGGGAEHRNAVTVLEGEPDAEVTLGGSAHGVARHHPQ